MMKLINIVSFLLLLLLVSCKPDGINSISQSSENSIETVNSDRKMKYKVDGKEMSKEAFYDYFSAYLSQKGKGLNTRGTTESDMLRVIAEDHQVVWEVDRPDPDGVCGVTNAFTSENIYYNYADNSGFDNAQLTDDVYEHLSDYAVSSGTIDVAEATGRIPQSYIDYMDTYLTQHGLPVSGLKDTQKGLNTRNLFNYVYKDCDFKGTSMPVISHPFLALFGFRDNISSFRTYGVFGITVPYYRSFFRRPLAHIWTYGPSSVDFCKTYTWINDDSASWFSY